MTTEPRSLHQRILAEISAKIVSGEWQPGHRIPFEHELTEIYGCSRMTVSKALTQLARSGLIERRKRSGSFVARPRSQAAVLEIHDIRTEVEALGFPYRYELLSRAERVADTEDETVGFISGTKLLDIVCLHLAGDVPFCLEERIVSLKAVPNIQAERFDEIAPGPWLLSHVPWSEAEHAIRAVNADRHMARRLGVPSGAACLVVERRTWTGGLPVTRVKLTYPGSSHAVVAHFAPS
ncbi:histidine utilization repressor [Mesorhizobium sp. CAU 1732]|uniref:histidine utilization repressor n=1 Tax=Mesorhizobium sp. CAU 1732 TaxID=3140358 RepID=UPI00325FFDFC